jgi:two-component system cell cycle response regulator
MVKRSTTSSRPPVEERPSLVPQLYGEEEGREITTTERRSIAPRSIRTSKWAGLMTLSGALAGKVYRLARTRTMVGRARESDVALTEHGVSRHHCTVVRSDDTFFIEDAGSTNGTLVNGERVRSAELALGDRIQIGPEVVLQLGWFDETEEALANRLVEAASRDLLTGTFNRRAFEERFAAELAYATRHKERLSAIALDIDHFKAVNDTHGHAVGDVVLRELAALVAGKLRAEDVFARIGGEEFIVIARGLTCENAARLAERLHAAVGALVIEVGSPKELRITVSLGVAELGETGEPPSGSALLELADERLYEAKRAGRDRVVSTSG